jgi:pimeloyl-ACP methyl ester carboxylesterase
MYFANIVKSQNWVPESLRHSKGHRLLRLSFKLLPVALAVAVVTYLIMFISSYTIAIYGSNIYDYSSPISVSWIGIVGLCINVPLFTWWTFLSEGFTRQGHIFASLLSFFFALLGIVNMAALASTPGEGAAAVLSLCWTLFGTFSGLCSLLWIKHTNVKSESTSSTPFCTWRTPLIAFGMLCFVFAAFFGLGFTAQNLLQSAEYRTFLPPGKLVSFEYRGTQITMHMWCRGPQDSGKPTMLTEHGGGSNSVSSDGVAEVWVAAGRRVCSYDRLGYGWTPSWIQRPKGGVFKSGVVLVKLLQAAGEPGPFICIGHSAGAAACSAFAIEATKANVSVVGVVGLDGYPDLIGGGCYRPGVNCQGSAPNDLVRPYVLFAGPTGIARPFLGVDPNFYPPQRLPANKALYARTRFWNVQYSDLEGFSATPRDQGYMYTAAPNGGVVDADGLVHYNFIFPNSTKVVWIPAWATSNFSCEVEYPVNKYCCSAVGKSQSWCIEKFVDTGIYWKQAVLYASTLSRHPNNAVILAPGGTEHGFLSQAATYQWTANTILSQFP